MRWEYWNSLEMTTFGRDMIPHTLTWKNPIEGSKEGSSQRLSHACVSLNSFSVKLRMAHYISYSLFGIVSIWITVVILGLIHVFSLMGNH